MNACKGVELAQCRLPTGLSVLFLKDPCQDQPSALRYSDRDHTLPPVQQGGQPGLQVCQQDGDEPGRTGLRPHAAPGWSECHHSHGHRLRGGWQPRGK